MKIESAWLIATMYVEYTLSGKRPCAKDFHYDEKVGQFCLELARKHALQKAIRFDGLKAEMGRIANALAVQQASMHEFFIEYIVPYLIAEGLTATGHIDFEWSGHEKTTSE